MENGWKMAILVSFALRQVRRYLQSSCFCSFATRLCFCSAVQRLNDCLASSALVERESIPIALADLHVWQNTTNLKVKIKINIQNFILALRQMGRAWSTDQITKPHYTEYILKINAEIRNSSLHCGRDMQCLEYRPNNQTQVNSLSSNTM